MVEKPESSASADGFETDDVAIEIPHIRQTYNWDCGLACVKMVLKYFYPDMDFSDFKEKCDSIGFHQTIWTVDLVYVLKLYNIESLFCTLTLGVDAGYAKVRFYASSVGKDENRVNSLFSEAESNGVVIEQRSVSLEEVLENLRKSRPVIVLINARLLRCITCRRHCLVCCLSCVSRGYYGHFIVLTGFNERTRVLMYKNPACKNKLCATTYSNFEECRHSYGTDDDIVFVHPPSMPAASS